MGIHFIFTTNNRNAAESVAGVIDNTPVKIKKNDSAAILWSRAEISKNVCRK